MVCYTNKCFVRLIDISKREIKSFGQTKRIDELLHLEAASIFDLKISSDGSKIAMIINYPKTKDTDLHLIAVWNIENDSISEYRLKEEPVSLAWEVTDSRQNFYDLDCSEFWRSKRTRPALKRSR